MKTTRGRKQDARLTNRRQKHELAYRAKKWRCSKLAVILADMASEHGGYRLPAASFVDRAKEQLRRANREARKPARGRRA